MFMEFDLLSLSLNMKTGNVVLDKWQKDILEHRGNVLLCTGRQVGKTTIFAIKAAERLIAERNCKIITVSLTEDQAKLIIIMVLDYLEKHYPKSIKKGRYRPTQNIINLKNGSQIRARPVGQTGDAVRGFTGNVLYVDEAAKMPQLVWDAAKPTLLTTAGDLWLSSTPCGKQGYFYEMFLNKDGRYKVFHLSSEEVIKKRPISRSWTHEQRERSIEYLKEEKRDMSELQYGQEYLGMFLDELRRYFSDAIIGKACILKRPKVFPKENNFLGVDIARLGGDECAYEVLHKTGDRILHISHKAEKEQLTTQTERDIIHTGRLFNCEKIGIDAGSGSLGVGIFDRLLENNEFKRKVVAMNNRAISLDREGKRRQRIFKEDMYDNLLNMIEKGYLRLLNLDEVKMSLRSIQWELIEGKDTRVHIFGDYSHIVEGLIRAAWLAKEHKINKLWIRAI